MEIRYINSSHERELLSNGFATLSEVEYLLPLEYDKEGNVAVAAQIYLLELNDSTGKSFYTAGEWGGLTSDLPTGAYRVGGGSAVRTDSMLPAPDCSHEQTEIENLLMAMAGIQTRAEEMEGEIMYLRSQLEAGRGNSDTLTADLNAAREELAICTRALEMCGEQLAAVTANRDTLLQTLAKCKKSEEDLAAELDLLRRQPQGMMDTDLLYGILSELEWVQEQMGFLQALNIAMLNNMANARENNPYGVNIFMDNPPPPLLQPTRLEPSPDPALMRRPTRSRHGEWIKYVLAALSGVALATILE